MKKLLIGITIASLLIGCADRREAQIKQLTERLTRLEMAHEELNAAYYSNNVVLVEDSLAIWQQFKKDLDDDIKQNEINKMLNDAIRSLR